MKTEISVEPEVPYPPRPEIDVESRFAHSELDPPIELPEDVGAGLRPARRENSTTPKRFRGPDKQPDSALLRHITHCSICNHPEREAIEQSILHWYSPTVIAHEFDLADRRIVYRHAHALGLFHRRMEQSRHALGFLIEQAQSIVPSADAIIRAVRALACIDDHGHWHEPRKEVVITHRYVTLQACEKEDATAQLAEGEDTGESETGEQGPKRLSAASSSRRTRRQRERDRSLGGRSFSSDKKSAPSPGVSTPEASEPAEPRHKSWSPLSLFSTRLLGRDRRNSSNINKSTKTSRHTIAHFDDAENRAVAPAPRRRF